MRRAVAGALALAALAVAVLVASLIGWAPRAHQPTPAEWVIQAAVLVVGLFVLVRRVTGKP